MILGLAIATLETSNPEDAQERKTALTNKHETQPAAARGSHHAASSSLNPNRETFARFHSRGFRIAAMPRDEHNESSLVCIAAKLHRRSLPVAIP